MIPSNPQQFWQYFDVITISILITLLVALIGRYYHKHGSLKSSISETIAHSKHSRLTFALFMTIFFPLYYAFVWFWVAPLLQMPHVFYYLLLLSAFFEMIFVWVPATDGHSRIIHQISAGVVGIFMFLVPIFVLNAASHTNTALGFAAYGYLLISCILLFLLLFKKMQKHTFLFEVLYCLGFLSLISFAAHY